MLIILEPDAVIRKKLCDLLNKERILSVDTITTALEKLCQFRGDIDAIIARVGLVAEIQEKQIMKKICDKLYIAMPPIVCYFFKGEEQLAHKHEKWNSCSLEYDESDTRFPFKYIAAVKEKYPTLNYDIKRANETWQGSGQPRKNASCVDPRKWLEEQGFVEAARKVEAKHEAINIEKTISSAHELLEEEGRNLKTSDRADYKKLYFELREKFENLLNYLNSLKDFIEK